MAHRTAFGFGLIAVIAVAGCSQDDQIRRNFERQTGQFIDEGGFGNPTMNNILVMSGQRDFAINLSNRFAAAVPTTINFAFNSTVLDAQARAALDEQARFISQFPEVTFRVYGHTDLVGSDAYNQRLGLRRAQAAVSYLVSKGISRSRLEALVSRGEREPVVATTERERRNRRTVTEVSGFVKNHPTVLQGKYAEVVYRDYITSARPVSGLTGTATQEFAE